VIRIIKLSQLTPTELAKLKRRSELDIDQSMAIARRVIDRIRKTGDAGVIEYARKFDYAGATVENLRVTAEDFAEAVRTRKALAIAGGDEIHGVTVLESILESARSGKPVKVGARKPAASAAKKARKPASASAKRKSAAAKRKPIKKKK
jgi:histidinol dehydrogenase